MRRRLVSIFILLSMLTSRATTNTAVRLTIYPTFQHGPGTIRVTLVIERDARNRQACVSIEGDTGYSRSSCWEHTGEGARYQTVIYYPELPAGHYVAQASVVRMLLNGEREEVVTPVVEFRLLGFGEDP